ncbi:unnamed protein product [Ilex paraguariensis]|uniref:Uncharacterized protein n=1 Tax=Ilex paraguariensis TaxID=185542 RepID=A0ABC8T6Z2_9AQUA
MTRKARNRKKSLCEKSMQVVVNIIKLSSFYVAGLNLGSNGGVPEGNIAVLNAPVQPSNALPSSQQSRSQRLQETELGSKSFTYLTGSDEGERSSYMVCGTNNNDSRFSDYIKRFHDRNMNELNTASINGKVSEYIRRFHEKNPYDSMKGSKGLPFILPPPPPQAK